MSFWLHESRIKRFFRTVFVEVAQPYFIGAVCLVVGFFYYWFLFPLWIKTRAERQKVENQVTLIDQARKIKKTYDCVQARIQQSQKAMQLIIKQDKKNVQPASALVQMIDKHHLYCHNMQIMPREVQPFLMILPVTLQASGSFGNIFQWMEQIAENKQGIFCRSLVLVKKNNRFVGLDAKFYLMSYIE